MKYFIVLIFSFFTFSCSDKNKEQAKGFNSVNAQEENIYSTEHRKGILFVKIGNFR